LTFSPDAFLDFFLIEAAEGVLEVDLADLADDLAAVGDLDLKEVDFLEEDFLGVAAFSFFGVEVFFGVEALFGVEAFFGEAEAAFFGVADLERPFDFGGLDFFAD
jgi:hypothetical protein